MRIDKKSLVITCVKMLAAATLSYIIFLMCLLGLAYISEQTIKISFFSDIIYIKDCYVKKIPYTLKNLSAADELTLYDYLDKKLVDDFYADNGSLTILSKKDFNKFAIDTEGYFNLTRITSLAYYVIPKKIIYIKNNGSLTDYSLTLVHEFGHYLSMEKGYARDEAFIEIANKEMKQLKKAFPYVGTNVEEYRAETFAYYILLPELLKDAAPETYKYHDTYYRELLE